MFDVSHFLTWEHGVSTNREVKHAHTHTANTVWCDLHMAPVALYVFPFFFFFFCVRAGWL